MNARKGLRELFGYTFASGGALLCDILVLAALIEFAGAHYLLAAPISFSCGTAVAYLLCIRYVFSDRRFSNLRVELALFWSIGVAGLVVNTGAMMLFVEGAGLHYAPAKAAAAIVSFMTNFLLRKAFVFTSRTAESAGRLGEEG